MTKTTPSAFRPQTSDLRLQTSDFRFQTSDFILVKDFVQDSSLDLHHRLFLSWLSIVKARFHSVFATPKIRACKEIQNKPLPKSEELERILVKDFC